MMFDVRLTMKERHSGIATEVEVRLEVLRTGKGYETYTLLSSIVGSGASPQSALLDYLNQQLHSLEALAFNQQRKQANNE